MRSERDGVRRLGGWALCGLSLMWGGCSLMMGDLDEPTSRGEDGGEIERGEAQDARLSPQDLGRAAQDARVGGAAHDAQVATDAGGSHADAGWVGPDAGGAHPDAGGAHSDAGGTHLDAGGAQLDAAVHPDAGGAPLDAAVQPPEGETLAPYSGHWQLYFFYEQAPYNLIPELSLMRLLVRPDGTAALQTPIQGQPGWVRQTSVSAVAFSEGELFFENEEGLGGSGPHLYRGALSLEAGLGVFHYAPDDEEGRAIVWAVRVGEVPGDERAGDFGQLGERPVYGQFVLDPAVLNESSRRVADAQFGGAGATEFSSRERFARVETELPVSGAVYMSGDARAEGLRVLSPIEGGFVGYGLNVALESGGLWMGASGSQGCEMAAAGKLWCAGQEVSGGAPFWVQGRVDRVRTIQWSHNAQGSNLQKVHDGCMLDSSPEGWGGREISVSVVAQGYALMIQPQSGWSGGLLCVLAPD